MRLCTGPVWMSADFFVFSGLLRGRVPCCPFCPVAIPARPTDCYWRLPRATSSPAPGGSRRVIGIDANEHSPTTTNAGQKSDHTIF